MRKSPKTGRIRAEEELGRSIEPSTIHDYVQTNEWNAHNLILSVCDVQKEAWQEWLEENDDLLKQIRDDQKRHGYQQAENTWDETLASRKAMYANREELHNKYYDLGYVPEEAKADIKKVVIDFMPEVKKLLSWSPTDPRQATLTGTPLKSRAILNGHTAADPEKRKSNAVTPLTPQNGVIVEEEDEVLSSLVSSKPDGEAHKDPLEPTTSKPKKEKKSKKEQATKRKRSSESEDDSDAATQSKRSKRGDEDGLEAGSVRNNSTSSEGTIVGNDEIPTTSQGPDTPKLKARKSVTFTPETKQEDGNSAQNLFQVWASQQTGGAGEFTQKEINEFLPPQSVHPANEPSIVNEQPAQTEKKQKDRKKKKKQKNDEEVTDPGTADLQQSISPSTREEQSNPALSEATPEPEPTPTKPADSPAYVTYLQQYHTDKSAWKFNKAKQNDLLKNIYNLYRIPSTNDTALEGYISGLQGDAARSRLRDSSRQIAQEDSDLNYDSMIVSLPSDERLRKEAYVSALKTRVKQTKQQIKSAIEKGKDQEFLIKLRKRKRAEQMLLALGPPGPTTSPPNGTSTPSGRVGLGIEGVVVNGDAGLKRKRSAAEEEAGKQARRRKRRTGVPDDDDTSSSSDSDDEAEDAEVARAANVRDESGDSSESESQSSSSSSSSESSSSSGDSSSDESSSESGSGSGSDDGSDQSDAESESGSGSGSGSDDASSGESDSD